MNNFPLLKSHWFIACQSKQLRSKPLKRLILGVPLVLFRANGRAAALLDRCPHRNAPLSQGALLRRTGTFAMMTTKALTALLRRRTHLKELRKKYSKVLSSTHECQVTRL